MRPRSRVSDAIWTVFTEAIRFIVVPYVLVDLVTKNYPELDTAFMPEIRLYIIFFGVMITSASTLESINKPGTFRRMLFGLSSLAFICLWLFVVFGGGIANFRWGPYFVEFDMSKIVYIMLFGVSLKAVQVMDTYGVHRHRIVEEEKLEKLRAEKKRAAARKQAVPRRKAPGYSFSGMSKVAYQVTPDEEIGSSEGIAGHADATAPSLRDDQRRKECPICGEPVRQSDTVCKSCGAWISRPTHGRSR